MIEIKSVACALSTNRGRVERIFSEVLMLSLACYLVVIAVLIYWVEMPGKLVTNSLIIHKNPAEALEVWLKNFSWNSRNEPNIEGRLPRYKFYTDVVETLLNLARKMGGNYQDSLLHLREGLQSDRQFEKKLKEITLGCWFQMGMMFLLTWGFILSALFLVEIKVSFMKLFLIFLWQIIGLLILPIVIKKLRIFYFADIGRLWKMLYILKSLSRVPLSRTEVMGIAEVQMLRGIQQKSLMSIVEKLKQTCQKALQIGGSYDEEVDFLMKELRFQEKWHFELFEKKLVIVKLGLLSIFFLPSYLAFVFVLLGDLLTLM